MAGFTKVSNKDTSPSPTIYDKMNNQATLTDMFSGRMGQSNTSNNFGSNFYGGSNKSSAFQSMGNSSFSGGNTGNNNGLSAQINRWGDNNLSRDSLLNSGPPSTKDALGIGDYMGIGASVLQGVGSVWGAFNNNRLLTQAKEQQKFSNRIARENMRMNVMTLNDTMRSRQIGRHAMNPGKFMSVEKYMEANKVTSVFDKG